MPYSIQILCFVVQAASLHISSSGQHPVERDPVAPDELYDSCDDCAYTVDFRCYCGGHRHVFGSIAWCLSQTYSLIDMARAANVEGMRCAVVRNDSHVLMRKYVAALNKDLPVRLISGSSQCVEGLPKIRVSAWWDDLTPSDVMQDQKTTLVPRALAASGLGLQRDARKLQIPIGGAQLVNVILLVRLDNERQFTEITEHKLTMMLAREGYNVIKHYGNESVEDQISMFSQAKGVVGYVGAGLMNTLFSTGCLIEVTTFLDLGHEATAYPGSDWKKHNIWLSSWQALGFVNTQATYINYAIPLESILEANILGETLTDLKDGKSQCVPEEKADSQCWNDLNNIPYVELSDNHVSDIAAQLRACIEPVLEA
jgi:hypothetical protein